MHFVDVVKMTGRDGDLLCNATDAARWARRGYRVTGERNANEIEREHKAEVLRRRTGLENRLV